MPVGTRDEKRVTSGVDFLPAVCTLTFDEHKVGLDEKSNVEGRFRGFKPKSDGVLREGEFIKAGKSWIISLLSFGAGFPAAEPCNPVTSFLKHPSIALS